MNAFFSDDCLDLVAELRTLTDLNLWYAHDPGTDFLLLSFPVHSRTEVTDAGVAKLTNLSNLTKLDLSRTAVGDNALAAVQHLPLCELGLKYTHVTVEGLRNLLNIEGLSVLALTGVQVGLFGRHKRKHP